MLKFFLNPLLYDNIIKKVTLFQTEGLIIFRLEAVLYGLDKQRKFTWIHPTDSYLLILAVIFSLLLAGLRILASELHQNPVKTNVSYISLMLASLFLCV